MRTFPILLAMLLTVALGPTALHAAEDDEGLDHRELIESIRDSQVLVEWTLKFDQGDPPMVVTSWGRRGGERFIREQRPVEQPGYVLSPRTIVTSDPMVHPRFVEAVHVRIGDRRIAAVARSYPLDRDALLLETEQPIEQAVPLRFDADAEGPHFAASMNFRHGQWQAEVEAMSSEVVLTESGQWYSPSIGFTVILTDEGEPVGVTAANRRPADQRWQGSPSDWPSIPAERLRQLIDQTAESAERQIVRVQLGFRSPRQDEPVQMRFRSWGNEQESQTERHVAGVVLDDRQLLVLADLEPKLTARLDRIIVHHGDGETTPAAFAHSLRDLGGFVATLEDSVGEPARFSDEDLFDLEAKLLIRHSVQVQGEQVERHTSHDRFSGFELGWRRILFPDLYEDDESMAFVFDLSGRLVTIPIKRRLQVSLEENWRDGDRLPMPVRVIGETLDDLPESADPNNVPLSEEEESRLAWLGVELQQLGRELAREHGVAHLTRDGELGGLVVYVYPDSPAAEAGIEPGAILLRVEAEGEPKPIDVQVEESPWSSRPFPWAQYDQIPEQYYEQLAMNQPWPQAETPLTRKLTDLGFGRDVTLVMARDGEVMRKQITVQQSPPHYGQASKFESEAMGVTVRDLTYEVRMYFQRDADAAGVIVSRVEPGSKGSVAGVKPHEIITHVNDQPVHHVEDFEKLVSQGGELKLTVVRMTRSRVVKVDLPKPEPAEEESASTQPAE